MGAVPTLRFSHGNDTRTATYRTVRVKQGNKPLRQLIVITAD